MFRNCYKVALVNIDFGLLLLFVSKFQIPKKKKVVMIKTNSKTDPDDKTKKTKTTTIEN